MQHVATLKIPMMCQHIEWDEAWPTIQAQHPVIADEAHEIEPHGRHHILVVATIIRDVDADDMADAVEEDYPGYSQHIVTVADIHGNPADVNLPTVRMENAA